METSNISLNVPDVTQLNLDEYKQSFAGIHFLNNIHHDACTYEHLFSKEQCEYIIDLLTNNYSSTHAATGGNPQDQTDNDKIRKSIVRWINPTSQTNFIYEGLKYAIEVSNKQYFNFDLRGFAESLQFTEYHSSKHHYDLHKDSGSQSGAPRKLSLTVQLSDPKDYKGGDLKLLADGPNRDKKGFLTAPRTQGTVTIFPSYTYHKVTPVTEGVRYSLVAWICGPNFK